MEGDALKISPCNIFSAKSTIKINFFYSSICAVTCSLDICVYGSYTKYTSAVGKNLSTVSLCTCVEYNNVFICSSVNQTGNFHALSIAFRITAGSHYYAYSSLVVPAEIYLIQSTCSAGQHNFSQVAVKQRQHYLSFGVTEAAVEFYNLHAVALNHQTSIEAALIRHAFRCHGSDNGLQNQLGCF